MARKFILNNGFIKLGNVQYHKDLAKDHATTKGGGMWDLDEENNILYLWGASSDYGPADPEDIKYHITTGLMSARFTGHKVMYSAWISPNIPSLQKFTLLCTV